MLVFSSYVKSRIIARGVLSVEQAGGGTGEQVLSSGSRRPAIPGLVLVRRPRTRLAPSYSGGGGAPLGDTTIPRQELADGSASSALLKARPAAERRTPQQSAERRAGGPYPAGDLRPNFRRSAYPRGRPSGAALPHQRLSALCSPH